MDNPFNKENDDYINRVVSFLDFVLVHSARDEKEFVPLYQIYKHVMRQE